jgi:hypothetical protein
MHFAQNVIDKHQSYMSLMRDVLWYDRERGWVGVKRRRNRQRSHIPRQRQPNKEL